MTDSHSQSDIKAFNVVKEGHSKWVSSSSLLLDMDQLPEYLTIRTLLKNSNYTKVYNFSGADTIFQEEFMNGLYTIKEYSTVVLLTMYVPIFIIGLIGNILIIIISARDNPMKKSKNYFLANLAVADLAVTLFGMPVEVGLIVYRLWVYGRFLCKFIAFLQGVAVAVSIFSLTAMSIDRYISIQHPVASRRITSSSQTMIIIISMWIICAIFMGPLLYIRDIDTVHLPNLPKLEFCVENWPQDRDRQAYGLFLLLVIFIIPDVTLIICYAHVGRTLCTNDIVRQNSDSSTRGLFSRKRAARMLIILVIVFMICWLPYNIASLASDMTDENILMVLYFTLWLGHAHSAINPIMFWLLNRQFRRRVRGMMVWLQARSCSSAGARTLPDYV